MKKDVRFLTANRDIRRSILRRWLGRCSAILLFFIFFVVLSRLCEIVALDLLLFYQHSSHYIKIIATHFFFFPWQAVDWCAKHILSIRSFLVVLRDILNLDLRTGRGVRHHSFVARNALSFFQGFDLVLPGCVYGGSIMTILLGSRVDIPQEFIDFGNRVGP